MFLGLWPVITLEILLFQPEENNVTRTLKQSPNTTKMKVYRGNTAFISLLKILSKNNANKYKSRKT